MTTGPDEPAFADLRRQLEARREELIGLIADGRLADQPVSPDPAIGRLTRQDAMQQQQMAAEIVRRLQAEQSRVELALRAMAAGEYGVCRLCEEPIAIARLRAMPDARLCVTCADRKGR
ncbi:MAG TPA: TraR/DksA C4-type zinc finger protein [Vicinamibacterales bacterium]|nr:TraR/DksA C4-type zinc finger protein [Vicinamibacterales bacterium]